MFKYTLNINIIPAMKKSIYNTYLHPTENSTVIYNAFTDMTMVVPDKVLSNDNILDRKSVV